MRKLSASFVGLAIFISAWMISSTSESRTAHWTCEMNAYFTGTAEQQTERRPSLEGQGLMTCQNVSGFNFDLPVKAHLKISRTLGNSEVQQIRVTLFSQPFVVARDLNQIYDTYQLHSPSIRMLTSGNADMTLAGKSGQLLPIKISVPEDSLGDWAVSGLDISFDEDAPVF